MKHLLKRVVSSAVSVTTALSLSALGLSGSALAGAVTHPSVLLDNPVLTQSSVYQISFIAATSTDIRSVKFQFTTTPSGGATKPTNMDISGVSAVTAATYNTSDVAAYSGATPTVNNGTGTITVDAGSAQTSAQGGAWVFTFSGITNPADGDGCDAISNSESCYVRITTYSDNLTTAVDTGSASFTAITSVTVNATIDPYMAFTVGGVALAATAKTNDAQLSGENNTNYIGSVSGTSIPFGNVTVGVPKWAQQYLKVRTNAGNGYDVYQKFTTAGAADMTLKDASGSNIITTFKGGGATWAGPQLWASPTGTAANTNSAWIGARVAGSGAPNQFAGSAIWGKPGVTATVTGNLVKHSNGPDDGQDATNDFVTYKIEANAYQPAQAYQGTLVYNAVPVY